MHNVQHRVDQEDIFKQFYWQHELDDIISQFDAAVGELLKRGMNVNNGDEKNRTALHLASAGGHSEIVGLLLSHGADPHLKDLIGNTPLHLATCSRHLAVISALLSNGADVNALDGAGNSPYNLVFWRFMKTSRERSTGRTSDQLKLELQEIVNLMKLYTPKEEDVASKDLDEICSRLERTTTKEEVCQLGGLLNDFAQMQIIKKESSTAKSVK